MMDSPLPSDPLRIEPPPLAARIGLIAGPVLAVVVYLLLPEGEGGLTHAGRACGGVATLMAVWWMTEALPLEATALLPLLLLPLTGVYTATIRAGDVVHVKPLERQFGEAAQARVVRVEDRQAVVAFAADEGAERSYSLGQLAKDGPFKRAAASFAEPAIFLFLGGFLIALTIQRWGLHRRIALLALLAAGTRPTRLIGGFMLVTALTSMWISNTATTVMMLPIGLSVVALLMSRLAGLPGEETLDPTAQETRPGSPTDATNFATCLLLGIAYAASLGGIATLIGTPPNVYFKAYMASRDVPIDFLQWSLFAAPVSLVFLVLTWWIMTRWLFPVRLVEIPGGRELILTEYRKLGPVSRGEWIVLTVFLCTAALWITSTPLKNWTWLVERVPVVRALDDYLIAMAGAIALFVIPVDPARHVFALDWKTAVKLPWGVLLLFGGGLSLAAALTDSGLAGWVGQQVTALRNVPAVWQMVFVVVLIVFTGELASNLSTVVAMLPILFEVAVGLDLDPLLLCVPAVVAASCGFMLPVATPPNAIVFGSGHIRLGQMVWAGFTLDLLAIVLIPLYVILAGAAVLGIRM